MGCVASKLDINDVHPNMFAVNNVDDVRFIFVFVYTKLYMMSNYISKLCPPKYVCCKQF